MGGKMNTHEFRIGKVFIGLNEWRGLQIQKIYASIFIDIGFFHIDVWLRERLK
jgi:hypothetical protein